MISAIWIRVTGFAQLVRPIVIGKWLSRICRSANRHSVKKIRPLDLDQLCRFEQVGFRASVVHSAAVQRIRDELSEANHPRFL